MTQAGEPDDPWAPKGRKPESPPVPTPQEPVAASVVEPAPPPPLLPEEAVQRTSVQFTGTRKEWLAILLHGYLLYIPTFGFYRFWMRTDQRRFMWRSIAIEGEVLEYHGTARELLTGFLIAIAIYLPISVAYTLLGIYAETIQAFASIPFFLFTVLFGYYAAYRARRYRLTRTVFRGIRFWMDGSAWRFAFIALGWIVILVLTLGLAWPWMAAKLERIKWAHSHYGDLQGEFHGTGWGLTKALFWPALGLVIGFFIPLLNLGIVPIAIAIMMVAYARWLIAGVSFGPVRLSSDADNWGIVGASLMTVLACGLFAGIWIAIGYVTLIGIVIGFLNEAGLVGGIWELLKLVFVNGFAFVLLIGWAVVLLIGLSFLKAALFDFPRQRLLASTTKLTNAQALEAVVQKGQAEGSFGEGLADALGSDGF